MIGVLAIVGSAASTIGLFFAIWSHHRQMRARRAPAREIETEFGSDQDLRAE